MALSDIFTKKLAEAQSKWHGRNNRIKQMWDLVVDSQGRPGTDYLEAPGQESVVGNDPVTDLSMAIHLLSSIPPRHRVLVSPDDNLAKEAVGKAERGLVSIWRSIDDERLDMGMEPWVREVAFWLALTGCYDIAPRVEYEDGKPVFIADIHNPEYGYPIYGDRHLLYYAYIYPATVGHVLDKAERYGTQMSSSLRSMDPSSPATIADVWERTSAGVFNTIAMTAPEPQYIRERQSMDQDTIPVLCGTAGGIPRFASRNPYQSVSGSILWENERIYRTLNRWRTHQMQLARDASQSPLIVAGSGLELTKQNTRQSDIRLQGDILWTPNTQATVRRVDPAPMPVDIRVVDSQFEAMRQRGAFTAALFGSFNVDLSGFAIQQLLQAAFHRVGPHKTTIERLISRIDRIWLDGFRDSSRPITISGRERNKYFREELDPAEVPESFDLIVDLRLSLPNDLMSRLSSARTAIPNGPLLDRDTVLDEVIQVEDPTLVKRRIDEDVSEAHPIIMQLKFMKELFEYGQELREKGQVQLAQIVENMVTAMMNQSSGASGAKANPTQPNPAAMPPEAQGMSPDLANALLGQQRGVNGPANVPAEMQGGAQ